MYVYVILNVKLNQCFFYFTLIDKCFSFKNFLYFIRLSGLRLFKRVVSETKITLVNVKGKRCILYGMYVCILWT